MAWVEHEYTVEEVIKRAARLNGDQGVLNDTSPVWPYYDALNDFLKSFARKRDWWFLEAEEFFATANEQWDYDMRIMYKGAVTFTGAVSDADTVTINSRVYEFDTDSSITGDVTVDVSSSTALDDAADALVSAINSDSSTEVYAYKHTTGVVSIYWAGTYASEVINTSGANFSETEFAVSMPGFSKLRAIKWWENNTVLLKTSREQEFRTAQVLTTGQPGGWAVTGNHTLRVYSTGQGRPDGIYLIKVIYTRMPRAITPEGQNDISDLDFPTEFMDLLPKVVAMIVKQERANEEWTFQDPLVQEIYEACLGFSVDQVPDRQPERGGEELYIVQEKRNLT